LAERYDAVYQRTAVVHTLAPTTYWGLSKMFLRWDRSYIREEFHLARQFPSRPLVSRLFAGLDLVASNTGYAFGYATLLLVLGVAAHDLRVGEYLLLGIGLGGVMNTLFPACGALVASARCTAFTELLTRTTRRSRWPGSCRMRP